MVDRWHPTSDSIMLIAKHPGGDYVRHSDYAALEAQVAERVKDAAIAGWDACRKSIYAVCEDVQDEADRLQTSTKPGTASEEQHAKGYYAGSRFVAKSIARGFNSMDAEDDDNLIDTLSALEATPPAPKVTDAMVERACKAWWPLHWPQHMAEKDMEGTRQNMRHALTAAQESGE